MTNCPLHVPNGMSWYVLPVAGKEKRAFLLWIHLTGFVAEKPVGISAIE